MTDRYPGLWPFKEDQANIFYGREREKFELYNRVRNAQVTIVFAKSGIGKSSLLNAGIVPLLTEADYLPINISFTKTESGKQVLSPLDKFKNALKDYAGQNRSPFNEEEDNSLWFFFKSCIFQHKEPPVLIFDQFEELFTYSVDEINSFLLELSELIHELPPSRVVELLLDIDREERRAEHKAWVTQPPVKFIFAIRSDKLAELQKVDDLIPGLFINRYQLLPMNEDNAKLAIINPALDPALNRFTSRVFTYDDEALTRIMKNLRSDITNEIEPYQLQIICKHIEEKVKASYKDPVVTEPIKKITINEFDADKETDNVLHNYYEQQLAQIGSPEEQSLCRSLLEKDLLEQSNNSYIRIKLSAGTVRKKLNNNSSLLAKLLESRLIKPETDEFGAVYFQISHDSLKDPILKSKFDGDAKETELANRTAKIDEARTLINNHYEYLKNNDTEKAIESLSSAELLFKGIAETEGVFETGILISKVLESKRNFEFAKSKLHELIQELNEGTEQRRIGIVNECFGVIYSKEGDEQTAFSYFKKALNNYEAMPGYDQVARMSEHLGGIKEELFYNFQRNEKSKKEIDAILLESDDFYTNATKAYALINDNFGYERVKRSLRRLQENRVELETPGFTHKPWGYLTELFTGNIHELKGKGTIRMGRDAGNLKNEIGFNPKNNFMSRRHASITPDMVIEDTQSLNGTTVNSVPLYYGDPRKLINGDIIVLGNTMPMIFSEAEPYEIRPLTKSWGIFIDGDTRTFYYMTLGQKIYSVDVIAGTEKENPYKLSVVSGDAENSIIKFRLYNFAESFIRKKKQLFLNNIPGQWKIWSTAKDDNRQYVVPEIPVGIWTTAIVFPIKLQLVNDDSRPYNDALLTSGPKFQFIPHEDYDAS